MTKPLACESLLQPWLHILSSLRSSARAGYLSLHGVCYAAACILQDVAITTDEDLLPKTLACLLRRWKLALLRGARSVEALKISAEVAPCPPVLGYLSELKYLEIALPRISDDWVDHLFDDLSFCYSLKASRITQAPDSDGYGDLPEIQLNTLPNLKRFELVEMFPGAGFSLPPNCELCVTLTSESFEFEEQWKAVQRHLKVLTLADMGDLDLTWQAGFERLSWLQYFKFESGEPLTLDLAELMAIPYVELHLDSPSNLTLTDGAWQTLEVHGREGLCINFRNAEAFVRGTQRFLFVSIGSAATSQPMCASIREACSRQSKSCYQCGYMWQSRQLYAVRMSNCKEVMRLEPSHDGRIAPSGGLHDGYAGTPEDSPLWECLSHKHLACQADFWPEWDPHGWVFGQ